MFGNFRRKAAASVFLTALAIALVSSAALGGWRIWSEIGEAPRVVHIERATTPVPLPEPTPTTPERSVKVEKLFATANPTAPVMPPIDEEPAARPATSSATETVIENKAPTGKKHEREENLLALMAMRLHSEAYNRFIFQKGMGMSRMVPMLNVVKREWKMPTWTSEELAKGQSEIAGAKDLSLIHRSTLSFFANSNVGSDKERNDAARADANTKKEHLWEIKSLDLVGLVMHETPTVYISEKLPQMKDLAHRPTREMDVFEMEGLEELMTGKDLYIRAKDGTIRVLGPVRAGKACLKCHTDAKDGDMLGAFSYTLRPGNYQMHGAGTYQSTGNSIPVLPKQPGPQPPK